MVNWVFLKLSLLVVDLHCPSGAMHFHRASCSKETTGYSSLGLER